MPKLRIEDLERLARVSRVLTEHAHQYGATPKECNLLTVALTAGCIEDQLPAFVTAHQAFKPACSYLGLPAATSKWVIKYVRGGE